MKRTWFLIALVPSTVVVLGCQGKGPAPGDDLTEREDVIMAERADAPPTGARALGIPADQVDRDYSKLPHDPHGPAGHLNPPGSHVSGSVDRIDLGGVTVKRPEGWEYRHPTSTMRRAELGVQADEGSAGLVVYFFGNQGAGSAQANIERWIGQFKNPDGSPVEGVKPAKRKVAGFEVTHVEVAGTYVGGMGAGTPGAGQPDQRMLATIVATPRGPYYFKFLGDDAVVVNNRGAYEALLGSLEASD